MRACVRGGVLALAAVVLSASLAGVALAVPSAVDGEVDLTFGSCGVARSRWRDANSGDALSTAAKSVAVQADGRTVLAGEAGGHGVLARLLGDGSLDSSFGSHGSVLVSTASRSVSLAAVVVQPDGRIVAGGTTYPVHSGANGFLLVRLLPDGQLDPSFGTNGHVFMEVGALLFDVVVQPDGKIVAGGNQLVRLTASGELDATFGTGGIVNVGEHSRVVKLALQGDGRLVGLLNTNMQENADYGLLRLNEDGTRDPSFGSDGITTWDSSGYDIPYSLAIDPDGRVVSAGGVSQGGGSLFIVLRHLPSGELDTSFGSHGAVVRADMGSSALAVALQADSKPIVVTSFMASGYSPVGLVRLSVDGSIDRSFGVDGVASGGPATADVYPLDLAAAPGGEWVVGGYIFPPGGFSQSAAATRFHGPRSAPAGSTIGPDTCSKEVEITPVGTSDFGRVAVGLPSTPQLFTLTNTGTARVRGAATTLSGEARSHYVVVSDTCTGSAILPGSSCAVGISFRPTTAGSESLMADLILWDDAGFGSQSIGLWGVGQAPTSPAAWGWNGLGALATRSLGESLVPVPLPLTGTAAVASGYFHSLGLKADGTVWAWGLNYWGQLGNNSTVDQYRPIRVAGLPPISAIAAGAYHSLAVDREGSVWAWGLNHVGQLGDGSTTDRHRPVRIEMATVSALSGGAFHTLAQGSDGSAWSWGWNAYGQLGDGSLSTRLRPVPVPALINTRSVAAGAFHSLAVSDGKVMSWGLNHVGQLGDGSTTDRRLPVEVRGLPAGTERVAAGAFHSLAAIGSESLWSWGWNGYGQLGNNSYLERHLPVAVVRLQSVRTVTAGPYHNLAIQRDGTMWAWGWNPMGQVGSGRQSLTPPFPGAVAGTFTEPFPDQVSGMSNSTVIAAGALHSLGG